MQAFIKRLAGFSIGSIVSAMIAMVQVAVVTRLVTAADYGTFSFYRSILLQIPVLLCIGFDQAYVREYHEEENKEQVFQNAIFVPLIVAGLFFIGTGVASPFLSQWLFNTPKTIHFVLLGGIWCLFGVIERFVYLVVRMQEKALAYSRIAIAIKSVIFVLTLALLFLMKSDLDAILYGFLVGNIAVDFYLVVRFRSLLNLKKLHFDRKLWNRMLRYALPLVFVVGLSAGLATLDNLSLKTFSTPTDLGIYNVGLNLISLFSIVTTTFSNFWIPTALRWRENERSLAHFAFISDALLLLLSVMFFCVLAATPIVEIYLGKDFAAVTQILGLLSFRPILTILSETTVLGIMFARRTADNIWISVITFVPSVLLNVLLTPRIGFRGAALATALSFIVYYFARTAFSRRNGFSLPQTKHALVILILLICGIIQAMGWLPMPLTVVVGLLLTLFVQMGTVRTAINIRKEPERWDFS